MFYLTIAQKYANIRAFNTPNEGAGGGADEEAKTGDQGKAPTDAEVKAAEEAAAAAAEKAKASSDPAIQALAVEKADLLKEVMDKKTKLKDAQAEAAAAKTALAAYEGIDPTEVKKLLAAKAEADKTAAEAKGDWDRVKAMMVDEHKKELSKVETVLEEERNARKADAALIDELTIGNSFGNSEFIRESLTISPVKARRLYGDHFERKGGAVVAYDKPAGEKDRTLLVDATGTPLSFEEALTRIVDADPDKKGVLKARTKTGAGSGTDADKGKVTTPKLTGAASIAGALKSLS